MTKHVIRDIAAPERRSIRDINRSDIRHGKGHNRFGENLHTDESSRKPPARQRTKDYGSDYEHPRIWLWVVAFGSVIFVLFVLSTLFTGASAKIVPTQATIALDNSFTARKDAVDDGLPFKLVVVSDEVIKDIPTSEKREVERKASGSIIIYNAYSSREQRLIRNTRFETPDGKIYRIPESTVVPGTDVQNGEIIPGSIEVKVYADAPGELYNVDLSDFTIPGFKGDPRYDKFYARSKTPMTGGFSGKVNVVPDTEISSVRTEMQEELKNKLLENALSQVPEDFILYSDAAFFTFIGQEGPYETKENILSVVEKGTLNAIIFNKEGLSKYVAEGNLSTYDGAPILIRDLEDLSFIVPNKLSIDPINDDTFTFLLSGTAHLVWLVDNEALKRDLAGIRKDEFSNVVEEYSSIKRAEATIRPFWSGTFPEDPEDITIDIRVDE